jgi:hypothetical protein
MSSKAMAVSRPEVWSGEDRQMSINRVIVSSHISAYGLKWSYMAQGTPQLSFVLTAEEPGRNDRPDKTCVPVVVIGPRAEALAAPLEAEDWIFVEGKLAYRAGQTKASGKLVVTCVDVQVLAPASTRGG